ncbi:MAG: hypothetical protein R3E83_18575 [Burkholderiaceae bacterium]
MKLISMNAIKGAVALAAMGVLAPLPGLVADAHAWYGCPNASYELQLRNQNTQARCYRARQRGARVQPNAGCPVGTTYNRDYRGNDDFCLPVTGTVGPRAIRTACAPGQEVERRSGPDYCYQVISADEKPVSTNR